MPERRRISPTTVIACLALFFAVAGGSAIALQGRNTVDSGDIKRGAVKTSDIANNAVTTKKIRNNHVRAADIQNNAVGTGEIRDGQVAAGDLTADELWRRIGAAGQPAFNNGSEGDCIWSSITSSPPLSLPPAAFYKDHHGVVHFTGNAVSTDGPGGDAMCGGAGTEGVEDGYAFILPPGYRPPTDMIVPAFDGSGMVPVLITAADIGPPPGGLPGGAVYDITNSGGFYLEGIRFRVAGPGNGLPRQAVLEAIRTGEIPEDALNP